ncbi:hypothetical protein Dimus_035913 [Dionaea muscipula]
MDLIKRQRWQNLFKRREFVHIDAVKEFYARMTRDSSQEERRCENKWTGKNRRRDDDDEASAEEEQEEVEAQNDFDWEVVIDEAADQGESGSGEKFYDAEDKVQESTEVNDEVPAVTAQASAQQKKTETTRVDPRVHPVIFRKLVMNKLQVEFERARADRIQADLEKAQAENARLLALLQQAQSLPKP